MSRPVLCAICHAELAPLDRGRAVSHGDVLIGTACFDIAACNARVEGRRAAPLPSALHLARILRSQAERLRAVADESDQAAALLEGAEGRR